METYNIHEAKTHFSSLINRIIAGEQVIIGKAGKPVAVISPNIEPKGKRKLGLWEGREDIWIAEDFDGPDQEIIDMFEGKYSSPLEGEKE